MSAEECYPHVGIDFFVVGGEVDGGGMERDERRKDKGIHPNLRITQIVLK